MKKTKFFLSLFTYLTVNTCLAEEVFFESDISYKRNSETDFKNLKSGDKLDLHSGESLFVVSKKNIPLLILSPNSNRSKITVTDSNMSTGVMELVSSHLDSATEEIVEKLRDVEALLQKRDFSQASQIIKILKEKYRKNSSILFMSASVNYLQNDRQSAIKDLQDGLSINPKNENAKKFLSKLGGGQ